MKEHIVRFVSNKRPKTVKPDRSLKALDDDSKNKMKCFTNCFYTVHNWPKGKSKEKSTKAALNFAFDTQP